MIYSTGTLPRERLADRYLLLTTTRDLFPLCVKCGRNLSAEPIARLLYVAERNRFACNPCIPEAA